MDLEGLITEFRRRTDDAVEPYLTSDADLAKLATEAEREACVRSRLLYDDELSYAVAPGQHTIPLQPFVDMITHATFTAAAGGRPVEMDLLGMDWIREQCDWSTRSCSRPRVLAHVVTTPAKARIWPTPSGAGTLVLTAYRYPRYELEDPSDEPEIAEEHHLGLVDWMLFRVYDQKDSEQYDPDRAGRALKLFTEKFGERDTASVQRRHRERRRCTTRGQN